MDKNAFSKDGYIIDQSLSGSLSYGRYSSVRNGCGWICAFNLLRFLGLPVTPESVRDDLGKRLWLGRLIGTNPITLYRYLKKTVKEKGFPLKKAFRFSSACRLARNSTAGIILYRHASGVHYVTFIRQGGEVFRFLNAHYGQEQHLASFPGFLKEQSRFPLVFAAGIPAPFTLKRQ